MGVLSPASLRCLRAERIRAPRSALLLLCGLLGQRALSVLRPMLIDHCSQALGRDRRSPVQRPNVALKQRDQSHRRGRDDRGCAPAAFRHLRRRELVRRGGKHGDFAHAVTGPDCPHRRAPYDDISGTALNGEQRMPDTPLAGERLPGSDFPPRTRRWRRRQARLPASRRREESPQPASSPFPQLTPLISFDERASLPQESSWHSSTISLSAHRSTLKLQTVSLSIGWVSR